MWWLALTEYELGQHDDTRRVRRHAIRDELIDEGSQTIGKR